MPNITLTIPAALAAAAVKRAAKSSLTLSEWIVRAIQRAAEVEGDGEWSTEAMGPRLRDGLDDLDWTPSHTPTPE